MIDTHVHAHEELEERVTFGFWVYLMSDVVLFASLFAVYAVLHTATFGGPSGKELFSLPFVLNETFLLLTSSFTCGLALLAARAHQRRGVLVGLTITLLLGLAFLVMEVSEFRSLLIEGHGPSVSAFLSSFFTLVGTHGLHVAFGSLWMIYAIIRIVKIGIRPTTIRELMCLSLFWHFLDVIWIFIFTFVYLFGVI